MLLSCLEDSEYEEDSVALEPGGLLVIYSDGITEARSEDNEEFGEEHLSEVVMKHKDLSPQDLIQRITESVKEFAGNLPQMDDMTLVVVKRDE